MDRKCLEDRMMMTERVKRVIRSKYTFIVVSTGTFFLKE